MIWEGGSILIGKPCTLRFMQRLLKTMLDCLIFWPQVRVRQPLQSCSGSIAVASGVALKRSRSVDPVQTAVVGLHNELGSTSAQDRKYPVLRTL